MADFASVCVLSFNRLDFLRESLESLQAPGYPIEIIVGDDGSEPDVQRWLVEALHAGLVSRLVLNPPGQNEGVGAMVNRLFSVASGDPLVKSDQDLVYEPGAIGEFVRVLRENRASGVEPRIGTLGGFKYWTEPVDWHKMLIKRRDNWDQVEDYVSSCLVVGRDVWERLGPWPEYSDAFAEDVEWKRRLQEEGFVHALTKEDVVVNRGFGVGPSTVVTSLDENGVGTVQAINHRPRIFGAA